MELVPIKNQLEAMDRKVPCDTQKRQNAFGNARNDNIRAGDKRVCGQPRKIAGEAYHNRQQRILTLADKQQRSNAGQKNQSGV